MMRPRRKGANALSCDHLFWSFDKLAKSTHGMDGKAPGMIMEYRIFFVAL
jgi:hypothetical protein